MICGDCYCQKPGLGGTRQKNLQNVDTMQLEGGFGGILNNIGSLMDSIVMNKTREALEFSKFLRAKIK
jgi:hypothetical protein